MERYISKTAVLAEIEKSVKLLFENNGRIYDAYGNYFYKNAENDYRFYHKLDEDNWDEDKLTLTDVTESLFHLNTLEAKEVNLEKYLKEDIEDVFFDLDGVAIKGATHYLTVEDVKDIAKHFFELGLKAQKGE